MWIFCCGMQRSGSTVHYQITKEIVESQNVGQGLGWVEIGQFQQMYDSNKNQDRIFVVKTHQYIDLASELLQQEQAKAIYIYRDMRDNVVSMMNKRKVSFWRVAVFSEFIPTNLNAYYSWSNANNMLISKYEDMVQDLIGEVTKIARFLEIELNEEEVVRIAQKYSINKQKERVSSFDYGREGIQSGYVTYESNTLLHSDHIYSGEIDQWRHELSPIQAGVVECLAYDFLVTRGYSISQNWVQSKASHVMLFFFQLIYKVKRLGFK